MIAGHVQKGGFVPFHGLIHRLLEQEDFLRLAIMRQISRGDQQREPLRIILLGASTQLIQCRNQLFTVIPFGLGILLDVPIAEHAEGKNDI